MELKLKKILMRFKLRQKILLFILSLFILSPAFSKETQLEVETRREGLKNNIDEWSLFYRQRYLLEDVFSKRVDNVGNGFENLYGLRNFRVVLHGIAYRGGANNYYHQQSPRDNKNPLPTDGLENLCKEGFSKVYYMYTRNFNKAPHHLSCNSLKTLNQKLDYYQKSSQSETEAKQMLQVVYDAINDKISAPIYFHCWNGWHASGLISALILRQFCDLGPAEAIDYWNKNTDGTATGAGYDKMRNQIKKFKPSESLRINKEIQKRICPNLVGFNGMDSSPLLKESSIPSVSDH